MSQHNCHIEDFVTVFLSPKYEHPLCSKNCTFFVIYSIQNIQNAILIIFSKLNHKMFIHCGIGLFQNNGLSSYINMHIKTIQFEMEQLSPNNYEHRIPDSTISSTLG